MASAPLSPHRFTGKTVVVTGAGQGTGAAVATTAFALPFVVAWFSAGQKRRGVSPENEDVYDETKGERVTAA